MYIFDTNMIIYAMKHTTVQLVERIRRCKPGEIGISAITLAELEYGVCHSSKKAQNAAALAKFLSNIQVFAFDVQAAMEYGEIREHLTAAGTPIGSNDLLIASHARALGATLITHNTREFDRVKGLLVEDWAS